MADLSEAEVALLINSIRVKERLASAVQTDGHWQNAGLERGMETGVKAALMGTGSALGDRRVASALLDRQNALEEGTVFRSSGVQNRFYCEVEDQISLGAKAGRTALSRAGLGVEQVDALLHASAVPYQAIPATAPALQRAMGLRDGVAAFDINATCLGFLAALGHAAAMIETGRWRHVLVVSSERASRGLDWTDPGTAGLFGDGAGAAVLGPGQDGVGTACIETYPNNYEASELIAGGTRLDHDADPNAFDANRRFRMDGRKLYRVTRAEFGSFVDRVLARQGWTLDQVDCVVPHQASPRALDQMGRALGVLDKLVDMAADHGNMIAASLPVALDHAVRTGRAGHGARVLMLGTAAGVSFGAACLRL